jgi:carboxyl-terminal processing protease
MTFFALSAIAVLALLGGGLIGATPGADDDEDSLYKHLSVFTEVLSRIRQAYVEESDLDSLMAGALDGTTDALDPFSLYVPPDEVGPYLEARSAGNHFTGLTLLKERGVAFVVAVDPGSPAAAAGIEVSDLVAKIDDRSTRTMPLWEVEEMLAAAPGTRLDLELIRTGETVNVELELRPFDPPPVEFEQAAGEPPVGVIRIARFESATAAGVQSVLALAREQQRERLLIDLRGVAGGDPAAAYAVAELFAEGELGTLKRKDEVLESFAGEGEAAWTGSLVVLVSRGTLGPAELLASVLRQKAGAELVGERTFGWAGRRDSAEIGNGGRLFFTSAFYTGPDGEPLMASLEPDVRVDATQRTFEQRDVPLGDLILERGLERLRAMGGEESLPEAA